MNTKNSKILITGGHLTPALAVLAELQKRGFTNIVWVGAKYNQQGANQTSAEYKIIKDKNIPFVNLKTGKLVRSKDLQSLFYAITQLLWLILGFLKSLYIIARHRPKLVISFGGFLAVPVVFWGKLFRAKIVTHEQVVVAGLANRIIAKFAHKIFISWESSSNYFKGKKVILTGNPLRKEILKFVTLSDDKPSKGLPVVFVTGGNQGANTINSRVFELIPRILDHAIVIHQTGNSTQTKDFEAASKIASSLDSKYKNRYYFKDYYNSEEMAEILNNASLVVSRAGVNTVTEVLALNKLTIFIPIPWVSHNEQYLNAEFVKSLGLGYIIEQKNFTSEKLYQTVLLGLSQFKKEEGFDGQPMSEIKRKTISHLRLDAHKRIVDEIEYLTLPSPVSEVT